MPHHNQLLPVPQTQSGVSDQTVRIVTQREGMDSDNDSGDESFVEVRI